MLLTVKDGYVNKIHSIAHAPHWPVVLVIILILNAHWNSYKELPWP